MREGLFNRVLGEECGTEIRGDAHLLSLMKELVCAQKAYAKVADALVAVNSTGYGVVPPIMDGVVLDEPEIVRQGSQYGVRLKATAPSHFLSLCLLWTTALLYSTLGFQTSFHITTRQYGHSCSHTGSMQVQRLETSREYFMV